MNSLDILARLIAFPTVSRDPNRALIDYCATLLGDLGADVRIIEDPHEDKANLYATIGPAETPGVLLSGHTDVVPIDGQNWTKPAFETSVSDGKIYGRGTTDMKGFVASALALAHRAAKRDLTTPLHIALSYDEEIGCVGVRSMIDMLRKAPFKPRYCIVGEPTSMAVATGHKGKTAFRVTCTGHEAHSALAPTALNAIYMASDMIAGIRRIQDDITKHSAKDDDYDVPYTTLHVGIISGGTALNIVPNHVEFLAEIRNLNDDDPEAILKDIRLCAADILEPYTSKFPIADIKIEITNTYPPLSTGPQSDVVSFVKSLTGANGTIKVPFGTEGGLFDRDLDIPTVTCGPGSMAQGHKPDEYLTLDQLAKCDAMMDELLDRLENGVNSGP